MGLILYSTVYAMSTELLQKFTLFWGQSGAHTISRPTSTQPPRSGRNRRLRPKYQGSFALRLLPPASQALMDKQNFGVYIDVY